MGGNEQAWWDMKFDRYVTSYLADYQNAKSDWNYEDGCVLMGVALLYQVTGKEYYKNFIVHYMDRFINKDGSINYYYKEQYNIDCINTGKILFFLYEETKEEKYRKAIEVLMDQLRSHPRTKCNNFWHKKIYPNQIWLDGLYMAQPFYMEYETKFNHKKNYKDIISQFKNVRKYLYNEEKKLYYHGYDEAGIQSWADKKTGVSSNFWLRGMGWYIMALIDTMDQVSKEIFEHYKTLEVLFKECIKGVLPYQDKESKLFYQVIDRADFKNNYLETSGSAMIAYGILKGCSLGALQKEKYQAIGEGIVASLLENKLIEEDGNLKLKDICSVAGLGPDNTRDGSLLYYLSEPVVCDDQKGAGAFIMAYSRMLMLREEKIRISPSAILK